MRVFTGVDEFAKAAGEHLGYSDWHLVTQDTVDRFADATGDHQWIHTDPEQAKNGPFGATVAHGFLTLSLIPFLAQQIYRVDGLSMSVNYGLNKVRFPAAVPAEAEIRAGAELLAVVPGARGAQATARVTIERAGGDKPVCVAETLALLVP